MEFEWLVTLTPLFALSLNVLTQVLIVHLTSRVGLSIIFGAILGFFVALLVHLSLRDPIFLGEGELASVITYLALSFCFWAFLNLNITSLRIRLIREILHNKDGLPYDQLLSRYSCEEMFSRRMARLEAGHHVKVHDGRYTLKSKKLLILALVISTLRMLIIPSKKRDEI